MTDTYNDNKEKFAVAGTMEADEQEITTMVWVNHIVGRMAGELGKLAREKKGNRKKSLDKKNTKSDTEKLLDKFLSKCISLSVAEKEKLIEVLEQEKKTYAQEEQ